ncbi:c-type cytochrome [Desulfosarcina ovata]|uniref:Cytochrome c n=1 Tax=Desulfosarcina ovata subsp. ovata TaxID=2752305 RepID=A0A5K8ACR8_9BACT|nr:cytochrome c [Desulfosarcina ovata]BBO90513.1 cytochrome c [Desulfosarcina ovata subsp. ovata]
MMRKGFFYAVCCVLVVAVAGVAYAQFAKPGKAIAYRKAVMVLLGHHFGQIGASLGSATDRNTVAKNAGLVATLAPLAWEACMVPGTDKGDTTMASKVLKDRHGFTTAAGAFETAAAKLGTVASEGDMGAIKAQFGAVAKTCKACHGEYRSR